MIDERMTTASEIEKIRIASASNDAESAPANMRRPTVYFDALKTRKIRISRTARTKLSPEPPPIAWVIQKGRHASRSMMFAGRVTKCTTPNSSPHVRFLLYGQQSSRSTYSSEKMMTETRSISKKAACSGRSARARVSTRVGGGARSAARRGSRRARTSTPVPYSTPVSMVASDSRTKLIVQTTMSSIRKSE